MYEQTSQRLVRDKMKSLLFYEEISVISIIVQKGKSCNMSA